MNKRVFGDSQYFQEHAAFVISHVRQCISAGLANQGNFKEIPLKSERLIDWVFPSGGWAKVNIDGVSKGNPGLVGGGGVIRDSTGSWLIGFPVNLGNCFSILAKL